MKKTNAFIQEKKLCITFDTVLRTMKNKEHHHTVDECDCQGDVKTAKFSAKKTELKLIKGQMKN